MTVLVIILFSIRVSEVNHDNRRMYSFDHFYKREITTIPRTVILNKGYDTNAQLNNKIRNIITTLTLALVFGVRTIRFDDLKYAVVNGFTQDFTSKGQDCLNSVLYFLSKCFLKYLMLAILLVLTFNDASGLLDDFITDCSFESQ